MTDKVKTGKWNLAIRIAGTILVLALIVAIVLVFFQESKIKKQNATITAKNMELTSAIAQSDSLAKKISASLLDKEKKKADVKKMKRARRILLYESGLSDFNFGPIYWQWNKNPVSIKKGIKEFNTNFNLEDEYVDYTWVVRNSLGKIFGGDRWNMTDAIKKICIYTPKILKLVYNTNKDLIRHLKKNWNLENQGEQLIPYLTSNASPYEGEFEKYYQFHTTNLDSSIWGSEHWYKMSQGCIESFDKFETVEQVEKEYGNWRVVRANLDEKSKRILLNILTDYNSSDSSDSEESKKKGKRRMPSDFF